MKKIEKLKDVLLSYDKTDSRYFYIDKTFDIRGTDYTIFTKLRHDSINKNHIKNIYTTNGWYLLWFLMANATKNEFIVTNVNYIVENTTMLQENVIKALEQLQNEEIIYIREDLNKINKNTFLNICIAYNDNELYECNIDSSTKHGFNPMPTEFIRAIIPKVSAIEWAIYTVLCTHYNYFYVKEEYAKDTIEPFYILQDNCYAFPKQERIAECTGNDVKTIRTYLVKLENNPAKLVEISRGFNDKNERKNVKHVIDEDTGRNKLERLNHVYDIVLYQRIEYVYYCILNMKDDRLENKTYNKFFNKLEKEGFEEVAKTDQHNKLRNRDYIKAVYKVGISEFEKCLQNKDIESYKQIRTDYKIRPNT